MAGKSPIEWTESTWNPVTGCDKISAGCKNCYAERMARRLKAMGSVRYLNEFYLTLHWDLLEAPKKWRSSRVIFVNSMSDLFHSDVPFEFIYRAFETMNSCSQHTFQILTKRSERLKEIGDRLPWAENIWMGVSVEDANAKKRMVDLKTIPAYVRFLSCEPLIGPLGELDLNGIHWVIVGGESGPKSRPMDKSWVLSIRDQCAKAEVPFFFKQWVGVRKDLTGRELESRTYDETPIPVVQC